MSPTPIPADRDVFRDGSPEEDDTSMLVKVQGGKIYRRVLPEELLLCASGVKVNCFCNIYSGINQLKSVFNNQELDMFRQTAFGRLLGMGELKFVQGQLFTLLVLNYLEPVARSSSVNCLYFQIRDRVVYFKKSDYALIIGMKLGDERGDDNVEEYIPGSFCRKFFNGKMSVARGRVGAEFLRAGKAKRRNALETVKLGLLHLLVNHMSGNQDRTTIPALYMHLVEDLERFNAYPWGEHLWGDLVESVKRGCMILKSSDIWRFTFPGFLFPLQIWAFETFAGLEGGNICQRRSGWQNIWPRALRWNTGVKPRFSALDSAIFGDRKVLWRAMSPDETEEKDVDFLKVYEEGVMNVFEGGEICLPGFGAGCNKFAGRPHWGDGKDANVNGVADENGGQRTIIRGRAGVGRKKSKRDPPKETENEVAGEFSGEDNAVNGGDVMSLLRELLGAVDKLQQSNGELSNKVDALAISFKEHAEKVDDCLKKAGLVGKVGEKGSRRSMDSSVPSFKLGIDDGFTQDVEQTCPSGVLGGRDEEHDAVTNESEGGDLPQISLKTFKNWNKVVEQLRVKKMSVLGKRTCTDEGETKISSIEVEKKIEDTKGVHGMENDNIHIEGLQDAQMAKGVEHGIQDNFETPSQIIEDLRKLPIRAVFGTQAEHDLNILQTPVAMIPDVDAYEKLIRAVNEEINDGGYFQDDEAPEQSAAAVHEETEIQEILPSFADGDCQKNETEEEDMHKLSAAKRTVERGTQLVVYGQEQESVDDSDDNIPLAKRQRRVTKPPTKYTPGSVILGRNIKKAKERCARPQTEISEVGVFKGPFPEDPEEMPGSLELKVVADFIGRDLLKTHMKGRGRKYQVVMDNLEGKVKALYGVSATLTKTWYYTLYFSWGWLSDEHMQVVFYFLRMKGREFGHDQKYTTTDPSFMMLLSSLYERYLKKEITAAEAARNSNIMGTIVGGRPEYGRAWKETDYVYMPVAISSHWILLVLDIHAKTIRLYDSNTRRGASLRNLQQHLPCLQTFLPKILDILGVYVQSAAGDSVLSVEGVPGCPQQSDGSSCGVFVIKYAENLMMGKGLQGIDAAKINEYRKKLAVELLTYASITDLKEL